MLELLAGRDAVERKVNQSLAPASTRRGGRRQRAWAPALRPFAFVLDLGIRGRDARRGGDGRPCPETAAR